MTHRLTLISLFWMVASIAYCHENRFGLGLRGGVNTLLYRAQTGGSMPREHIGLDLEYAFLSDAYVGFRLGLAADYSASQFRAVPYADQYRCIDVENDEMDVAYTMSRLTEDHLQLYASLPVQLAFAYEQWTLFVGPKFMLPLYMHRQTRAYNVDLQCTYPIYESTVDDALALRAGVVSLHQSASRETLHPRLWYALSIETGWDIYRATRRRTPFGVTLSLFADIGLNAYDVPKTANLSLITLTDTRDGIPVNRVMESVLRTNQGSAALVWQYRYFTCGIKATVFLTNGIRKKGCKICFL